MNGVPSPGSAAYGGGPAGQGHGSPGARTLSHFGDHVYPIPVTVDTRPCTPMSTWCGPCSAAGQAAFDASLIKQFNKNYANTGNLWTAAPSGPAPLTLFSGATTYVRPGTTYRSPRVRDL